MSNLVTALMVAGGGATGALLRWGIGALAANVFGGVHWGTLVANLIGCFLIGFAQSAVTILDWGSPDTRLFLFTGLIGAFTTYSTFNHHIIELWDQNRALALGYVFITLVVGVLLYLAAQSLGTRVFS